MQGVELGAWATGCSNTYAHEGSENGGCGCQEKERNGGETVVGVVTSIPVLRRPCLTLITTSGCPHRTHTCTYAPHHHPPPSSAGTSAFKHTRTHGRPRSQTQTVISARAADPRPNPSIPCGTGGGHRRQQHRHIPVRHSHTSVYTSTPLPHKHTPSTHVPSHTCAAP